MSATLLLVALGACKSGDSGDTAAARAILYFDVTESAGKQQLEAKAVDLDGQAAAFPSGALDAVPAWAPDGKRFAYTTSIDGEAALFLRGLQGEARRLAVADQGTKFMAVAWSPDSRSLAVILATPPPPKLKAWRYAVLVMTAEGGKVQSRHELPEDGIVPIFTKFRWSSDGSKILVSSWGSGAVIEPSNGTVQPLPDKGVIAEWAPTSDAVYYFTSDRGSLGRLQRWTPGDPTPLTVADEMQVYGARLRDLPLLGHPLLSLSPNGRQLAVVAGTDREGQQVIAVYDLSRNAEISIDKPLRRYETADVISAVEWSPDGNDLAVIALGERPEIKRLNLQTGTWSHLATVNLVLKFPDHDFVGMIKTLSWTQ